MNKYFDIVDACPLSDNVRHNIQSAEEAAASDEDKD